MFQSFSKSIYVSWGHCQKKLKLKAHWASSWAALWHFFEPSRSCTLRSLTLRIVSISQLGNGPGLCIHPRSFCYSRVWSNCPSPPHQFSAWPIEQLLFLLFLICGTFFSQKLSKALISWRGVISIIFLQ